MLRVSRGVILLCMIGVGIGGWYWYGLPSKATYQNLAISGDTLSARADSFGDQLLPLAVIGSGPAGLSAALYGARFNIHTVVFEGKKPGGQLMSTSDVENWPGMGRELGPRIIERLRNQALQFGAFLSGLSVEAIDVTSWPYKISLDDGTAVYALTVIVATGAAPRTLQVEGEQRYWGKGVTSCAVCDAPFFRNRTVVVVGGGDAAVEEALQLASYATSITMLVRGEALRASYAMQQRLKAYSTITIRYKTSIKEILGDGSKVTGVRLAVAGGEEKMAIDGVFLAIGHIPNTALVRPWLQCDAQGYIVVEPHRQVTSQPAVFAAGDVADSYYRQAGIASGDGIKAAIDAAAFLREHGMDDAALTIHRAHFFNPQVDNGVLPEIPTIATTAEFDQVLQQQKVLVVDFYTPQCPSCLQLIPHLAAALKQYGDDLTIVKVDGSEVSELMERYEVHTVPTLLVFKKGMLVGRSTSLASRREVQSFIGQFAE